VRLNGWVERLDLAHHVLAATREHLDPLSDDLGLPVASSALVVPRPCLQAALDRDEPPLAEVAAGDLRKVIPGQSDPRTSAAVVKRRPSSE
jgi:hypothetical protein